LLCDHRTANLSPTSSSLDEIERRKHKATNKSGDPLKLSSKILAVTRNPYTEDGMVYVAESVSTVRGIAVKDDKVRSVWSGPTAPMTSICFADGGKSLWAGCWDKKIYKWEVGPGAAAASKSTPKALTGGHMDFVKCLLNVRTPDGQEMVLSGSADGDIIFWSLSGRRLYVLKGQSRGIEHLALDPLSSPEAPVVFVATSQRDIFQFALPSSTSLKTATLSEPIIVHETSVYTLFFDADGDLWTASADKTAKHLVRENGWKSDTTLVHPDFVRDVVVHEKGGWVITACRDEEVRVWDRSTGDLHHIFSGHFEGVTGLCLLGDLLVSVSIDATVRRWSLAPQDLLRAVEEVTKPKEPELEEVKPDSGLGMLTAEEEAELKELMDNEEAELQDLMAEGKQ
jgi:WD40 repeat protein